jgi:tRNA(Ile)-lysidine synthetase-like protein
MDQQDGKTGVNKPDSFTNGAPQTRHKSVSYVVAVSGGVDSVVLLHILSQMSERSFGDRSRPSIHLTVAHFDHGIREDSTEDRRFVERLAGTYGLAFVFDEGRLGAGASEAVARDARYDFLRRVRQASGAQYLVTAHHEDDVFETAILNLLRGTGRKGLSSLRSTQEVYRPLLTTPKEHVRAYAQKHGLQWREDSTNASDDYLRNYIRHNIMPRFDADAKARLRQLIAAARDTNVEIDGMLAEQLHLQPSGDVLDRHWFIMLPHNVAREIVAAWLRRLGVTGFDRQLLERIVVAGKTFATGKQVDVNGRYIIMVYPDRLVFAPRYV